jgi:hypothetical protein
MPRGPARIRPRSGRYPPGVRRLRHRFALAGLALVPALASVGGCGGHREGPPAKAAPDKPQGRTVDVPLHLVPSVSTPPGEADPNGTGPVGMYSLVSDSMKSYLSLHDDGSFRMDTTRLGDGAHRWGEGRWTLEGSTLTLTVLRMSPGAPPGQGERIVATWSPGSIVLPGRKGQPSQVFEKRKVLRLK